MKKLLLLTFLSTVLYSFSTPPPKDVRYQTVRQYAYGDTLFTIVGDTTILRATGKIQIDSLISSINCDTLFVNYCDGCALVSGWKQNGDTIYIDTSSVATVWSQSGNYTILKTTTDSVGIGTATPSYKLDVDGVINTSESYKIDGYNALSFPVNNTNIALGQGAGTLFATGSETIMIGEGAGLNATASNGVFIGDRAGAYDISIGGGNIAIGQQAGQNMGSITGKNVFIGNQAGINSDGSYNVAIGFESGYNNDGSNNVSIGKSAGYTSTGSNNVFLGYSAGYYETGSNKLIIENSNDSTALILGDFNLNRVGINADIDDVDATLYVDGTTHITGNTTIDDTIKGSPIWDGNLLTNAGSIWVPIGFSVGYSGGYINYESSRIRTYMGGVVTHYFKSNGFLGLGNINPTYDISFTGTASHTVKPEESTITTVGSNLTIGAGNTKATGTADLNGGMLTLSSGASKGTGVASVRLQRNSRASVSGTALNTLSDALIVPSENNLVDSVAKDLFEVALGTDLGSGGNISFTIIASNGDTTDVYKGNVSYACANVDGTILTNIVEISGTPVNVPDITDMVTTWTATAGVSKVTIAVKTYTSITTNKTIKINYIINNEGTTAITQL